MPLKNHHQPPRFALPSGPLAPCLVLASLALLLWWAPARAADPYTEAFERAAALERAGRPADAAAALDPQVAAFPQDYTLLLRLAWLDFQAGFYKESEDFYRRALALSPDSVDARHGLAWALLRQGEAEEARPLFQAVAAAWPEDATAASGLALSAPPPVISLSPSASVTGYLYQDNPRFSRALGVNLQLPLQILQHLLLIPDYRLSHFWIKDDQSTVYSVSDDFLQHELFLAMGAVYDSFGITAHYGFITSSSADLSDSHLLGLRARFSPFGDIGLEGSVSLHSDINAYRLAPSWTPPIPLSWLSLSAELALQIVTTDNDWHFQLNGRAELLATGTLNLTFHLPRTHLWVGGKVGDEVKPVYFALPAVSNGPDRVDFGAWAGATVKLGRGFSLFASYDLLGLEVRQADSGANITSSAAYLHLVTGGLIWSLEQ